MWKAATITKFAAHELISVVETGVHPAMNEIIIVDVDNELPMLAPQDPQYHRRLSERKRIEMQNATNRERIKRLTYKAWNVAFESLRQACVKNAPLLAFELYQLCAISDPQVPLGTFDGPRAWRILDARIEGGDGERTEFDKDFYDTALKYHKGHRLN